MKIVYIHSSCVVSGSGMWCYPHRNWNYYLSVVDSHVYHSFGFFLADLHMESKKVEIQFDFACSM